MITKSQRLKNLDVIRRVVEAKERLNAPNAKEWRKGYEKSKKLNV